ncbi:hypothetical protein Lupro_00300 [Lutibacter profundi]|uniref:Uncharacterized protein n=1 Tax=Lutibacter profundi TaxID=1622118 RepID=A0A0X8G4B4_9FLAO|nr:hypothetical protein [Lutibacter profundi]AMC09794.1 hypothetical protein Lupro_00300 [Lutibacter profundi]
MKGSRKTSLWIGSIIILIIIFIPYLLYIHQSIPREIENFDTIFGVIKGGYYLRVQTYVYFFLSKFVPLVLLIIWFVTNKHWWVHALIIPMSVYLFQLIAVINDSEQYVDEVDFIYTVPITAIIFVILYFIRSKLAIYIGAVDLKKEMDENMKNPKKIG